MAGLAQENNFLGPYFWNNNIGFIYRPSKNKDPENNFPALRTHPPFLWILRASTYNIVYI